MKAREVKLNLKLDGRQEYIVPPLMAATIVLENLGHGRLYNYILTCVGDDYSVVPLDQTTDDYLKSL